MHPALWISKTGLDAAQTDVAVVSNNLANASTVGFKKDRAVFEDLLYQNINQPGGRSSADTELPSGLMLGSGSKVVATQKAHTQLSLKLNENHSIYSNEGDITANGLKTLKNANNSVIPFWEKWPKTATFLI